jgi:hypothetical protein
VPVIDIDGSLWSVFVRNQGPDAEIMIQVCDGIDFADKPLGSHQFDGEWHDGDLHLFLDTEAAYRLLTQLRDAFDHRNMRPAGTTEFKRPPVSRTT